MRLMSDPLETVVTGSLRAGGRGWPDARGSAAVESADRLDIPSQRVNFGALQMRAEVVAIAAAVAFALKPNSRLP